MTERTRELYTHLKLPRSSSHLNSVSGRLGEFRATVSAAALASARECFECDNDVIGRADISPTRGRRDTL